MNVSKIRQRLDDASIRPVTNTDLYLVRDALHLANQLGDGYGEIIRDRAELVAAKLENELGLVV